MSCLVFVLKVFGLLALGTMNYNFKLIAAPVTVFAVEASIVTIRFSAVKDRIYIIYDSISDSIIK